jgi:hypothetical protein
MVSLRFARFALLWSLSALLFTFCKTDRNYFPPPESEGGWRKNTSSEFVRSLGFDPQKLEEFGNFNLGVPNSSWRPYADYKGIIVIKNGWIIAEWYNQESAREFRTYLSSNGKSFAIVAFGIMLKDCLEQTVTLPIGVESYLYDERWLPEGYPLSDPRKDRITFEQVFQHTSGICPENTASGEAVEQGRDEWTNYVDWIVGRDPAWPQTAPLYFDPGDAKSYAGKQVSGKHAYGYSSVSFGHIGMVLRNVYGCPAHEFLWKRLLKPLGFSGVDYHAPPSPDRKWFSAGGLRMTPRDYARFAYLLLHDGRWQGLELVPEGWIERFRKSPNYPNLRSNCDGIFGADYPADMFRIAGSGLNWAFIIPSMDLIALRTGRANNRDWAAVEEEFLRRLFTSLKQD